MEEKNIQFYSETGLDKYIRQNYYLDYSYKGIMVEVGGGMPNTISNSKHFRDNGWRTIVFEPNPELHKLFSENNIECYNIACSNEDKENVDFSVCNNNSGLSFSSLKVRYSSFHAESMPLTNIKVNTIRLDTFFNHKNIQKIDFMTIDVEGWELEVIEGFDPNKVNCKYIILENFEQNQSYEQKMLKIGYQKIHDLHYDQIYQKIKK